MRKKAAIAIGIASTAVIVTGLLLVRSERPTEHAVVIVAGTAGQAEGVAPQPRSADTLAAARDRPLASGPQTEAEAATETESDSRARREAELRMHVEAFLAAETERLPAAYACSELDPWCTAPAGAIDITEALRRRSEGYPSREEVEQATTTPESELEQRARNGDGRAALMRALLALQDRRWGEAEMWSMSAVELQRRKTYPLWLLSWSRIGAAEEARGNNQSDVALRIYRRAMHPLTAASMLGDATADAALIDLSGQVHAIAGPEEAMRHLVDAPKYALALLGSDEDVR